MGLIIIGIILGIVVLAGVYISWGLVGLTGAILLFGIIAGAFVLMRDSVILINELQIGVVFHKHTNKFLYFVDSTGRYRGETYLKEFRAERFIHTLNPFTETLYGTISKGKSSFSDNTPLLRTREGIPVSVSWIVEFSVDPHKIFPGIEHKLARGYPKNASKMIGKKASHELRLLIEEKSIEDLYLAQTGATASLEEELRQRVTVRTEKMGVNPISPKDARINAIGLPQEVEKALRAKHERELHTATLSRLQQVVSKFTDEDMERLKTMERLRIIEDSGAKVYMTDMKQGGDKTNGGSSHLTPVVSVGDSAA